MHGQHVFMYIVGAVFTEFIVKVAGNGFAQL